MFFFLRALARAVLILFLISVCLVRGTNSHITLRNRRTSKRGRGSHRPPPVQSSGSCADPRLAPRVPIGASFHRGDPDPAVQIPHVAPEMSRPRAHVDQRRELIGRQHRRRGLEIFDGERGAAPSRSLVRGVARGVRRDTRARRARRSPPARARARRRGPSDRRARPRRVETTSSAAPISTGVSGDCDVRGVSGGSVAFAARSLGSVAAKPCGRRGFSARGRFRSASTSSRRQRYGYLSHGRGANVPRWTWRPNGRWRQAIDRREFVERENHGQRVEIGHGDDG